ncbi:MAG: helix-turn-helix domain-containing protein [Gammaproteobacteria bacterium]|nr:helix-turn-helix transcriptional regulator [Gammaproteobacteria bacterium]NIV51113.1 helix-turn-helix domain-containing protein [Gammaproteobacteria bacterium]NIW23966.1 helix-turn-helix domain-containing protein [Gammaproteobacteria bacterium]NIX85055.1 helix-turn-helix domain-containing protein [Gammaproteobacteria bacterium]
MSRPTRVGNLLRTYRALHKLTWQQVAGTIGHSSTYVHDVASGRRRVTPATAMRYARALGEDVEHWMACALDDSLDPLRETEALITDPAD